MKTSDTGYIQDSHYTIICQNPGLDPASWRNDRTEEDIFYLYVLLLFQIMQILAKV